MILVIDNYDSFVHNLARYFRQLGCQCVVHRNDAIDTNWVSENKPQAIVISPGPCTPNQAGCSLEIVKTFALKIPILGICLGHQAIVQALGGAITLAHEPMHGRQSQIKHMGSRMFENIGSTLGAGRYHSLVAQIKDLPDCLKVTARSDDGTIMAVEHQQWPVIGLQFHPESVLTDCGYQLLSNFLTIANIEHSTDSLPAPPLRSWSNSIACINGKSDPRRSSRLSSQTLSHTEESQ